MKLLSERMVFANNNLLKITISIAIYLSEEILSSLKVNLAFISQCQLKSDGKLGREPGTTCSKGSKDFAVQRWHAVTNKEDAWHVAVRILQHNTLSVTHQLLVSCCFQPAVCGNTFTNREQKSQIPICIHTWQILSFCPSMCYCGKEGVNNRY